MSIIQGLILGIIQGLAEFLPISSSGHLAFARLLMNINDFSKSYLVFDILLHFGTLFVVIIYFWKDWLSILKNIFKSYLLLMLFIASLPALFAILAFENIVDYFSQLSFLGFNFIVTGMLLIITEKLSKNSTTNVIKTKNSLYMGCTQILGLLPGVSRSGSTIFGGVLSGLDKKTAAKFSFMMSAPAIVGSLIFELKKAFDGNYLQNIEITPTIAGVLSAFIAGYFAIKYMMKLINSINLKYFAIYTIILGIVLQILHLNHIL